jgi:pimeloyl-ACP methyl ester carboxylesterase
VGACISVRRNKKDPLAYKHTDYVRDVAAIVLVHGSFVDASCWDDIAQTLRARNRVVETVELHRGSLAADTAAVQDAVDRIEGPVVACGWSYGGMVITGLDLPAGSHLVYLCALMPAEGESAMSLGERHPGGLDQLLGVNDAGDLTLGGDHLDEILWADASADRAESARASLRSQAVASFLEAPAAIAWREASSTFVSGQHDLVFNPELRQEMAARATTVLEWDTSHSPVLSRPDLVVDLLDRLAV